jgi:hypothetical protein
MSIGWLYGNCLAIKNRNIALPYTFTLVHLDDRIAVNSGSGYSSYLVKSEQPANLAIGI